MRKRPSRSRGEQPASAKTRAVDLLARREHGARELQRKLTARGVDADEAAEAVDALTRDGWQSDERYARAVIRARAGQGYGPRRIRWELGGAGIADGAVAAAFDAEAIDWLDVAREWFARRHTPGTTPAERARHWRRLAGRGFDEATVRAVLGDAPEFE